MGQRLSRSRMDHPLITALAPAMRDAGALIEQIRLAGITHRAKADESPVTEADERAEALLIAAIRAIDPEATIVGEESCAAHGRPAATARFWLVDALDGTRDFVGGGADYSVNVGLIEAGVPILGLVLAPRTGVLWVGAAGAGAWRQESGGDFVPITTSTLQSPPRVVASRSHPDKQTDAYCTTIGGELRRSGSSLKFCMIADGDADVYPRFGPTSEWDTAAADAVLRAAGGMTRGQDGEPFAYAKPDYLNGPFLAVGDPAAYDALPSLASI